MKRLADQPFALLGVNSDRNRKMIRSVMKRENISWRSWWDERIGGPIASKWQVTTSPTLYVLDANGVIRHIAAGAANIDVDEIEGVIDSLLEELGN